MTDVSEELAIRFSEYLDGEMNAEEASAFEAELAEDEALSTAFEEFSETLNVLGGLGTPEVDLAAEVETKIRRRSQGRYFGRNSLRKQRVQTEIFIAIALILLAGIALLATPGGLKALLGPSEFELIEEPEIDPRDDSPSEEAGEDDSAESATSTDPDPVMAAEPDGESEAEVDPVAGLVEPGSQLPRAPEGATSGQAVMPMARHEFQYTVHTTMAADALQRRLRDQFGADSVREEDGWIALAVPRAEMSDAAAAVSALGRLERSTAPIVGNPETLDIIFEPGQ